MDLTEVTTVIQHTYTSKPKQDYTKWFITTNSTTYMYVHAHRKMTKPLYITHRETGTPWQHTHTSSKKNAFQFSTLQLSFCLFLHSIFSTYQIVIKLNSEVLCISIDCLIFWYILWGEKLDEATQTHILSRAINLHQLKSVCSRRRLGGSI